MRVRSVRFGENEKLFKLENGDLFCTHRYCCLGTGDEVVVRSANSAHALCLNGRAKIVPAYRAASSIKFGGRTLPLVVKEIEAPEELCAYHRLEEYHYRGTVLHGRRVPLIVTATDPLLPGVLGYIELSTAFMMSKPRSVLFDAPFKDASVGWAKWDKQAVRKYTNLVVRIARCVVSPEFRGLGLARILVEHAANFARDHWNVGRLKPLFLEITADMLRYVPFVEGAGMHYIGDTEGNLGRVEKDMNYILKNFARVKKREILKEETGGIIDLQVFYATKLSEIEKANGIGREQLLKLLIQKPHRLSDEHWSLLHRIYRSPKPSFLLGLSERSEAFVVKRIAELGLPKAYPIKTPPFLSTQCSRGAVRVANCGQSLESKLIRTRATRRIQEAFGISTQMMATTLFRDLSFDVKPGQIALLCGPSGAGKTTLLSVLGKALSGRRANIEGLQGTIEVPEGSTAALLQPLPTSEPLISALGLGCSVDDALFALNLSGLTEAHLYVKRFSDLSNGQRYRAMMAKLIASGATYWLADEFCATLDPLTANIVARNLRRCATRFNVGVVVAAANWSEFINELRPDVVVHLRSPWEFEIFDWTSFRKAISRSKISLA